MNNKIINGIASIGAGISMLVGIGAGEGIGVATGFAVEGVARQPEALEIIKSTLITGSMYALLPFLVAVIIAVSLLYFSRKVNHNSKMPQHLAIIGASIAVLAGIGAGKGIGNATGYAAEGVARQPEAFSKIVDTLTLGSIFALIPVVIAFLIAIYLVNLSHKSD